MINLVEIRTDPFFRDCYGFRNSHVRTERSGFRFKEFLVRAYQVVLKLRSEIEGSLEQSFRK